MSNRKPSEEDLAYYRAEVNSMKELMDRFEFVLHNFETPNQYYTAKHKKAGAIEGVGRIPAEAVGDWIDKVAAVIAKENGGGG